MKRHHHHIHIHVSHPPVDKTMRVLIVVFFTFSALFWGYVLWVTFSELAHLILWLIHRGASVEV